MRVEARAKINLRLRVLARDASGFHQIETIFCRISLADELVIEPARAPGVRLDVSGGDVGPAADNLVTRAIRTYCDAAGLQPAFTVTLHKRIPAGAGLGGGSSDAAATLRALDAMHERRLGAARLLELAATLGSDVPFFVADAPLALAWGRGQRLLTHAGPGTAPALIVMPPARVSTADAYERLAVPAELAAPAAAVAHEELASWKRLAMLAGNDFERVVVPTIDGLDAALHCLRSAGALIAQLTGSGAAVFGVFESSETRDAAATAIAAAAPGMHAFTTVACT